MYLELSTRVGNHHVSQVLCCLLRKSSIVTTIIEASQYDKTWRINEQVVKYSYYLLTLILCLISLDRFLENQHKLL